VRVGLLLEASLQEENSMSSEGLSALELQALKDFASKNRISAQRVTERLFDAGLIEVMRLGKPKSTEEPALLPAFITAKGKTLLDNLAESK
jgi:hypothetical protein